MRKDSLINIRMDKFDCYHRTLGYLFPGCRFLLDRNDLAGFITIGNSRDFWIQPCVGQYIFCLVYAEFGDVRYGYQALGVRCI